MIDELKKIWPIDWKMETDSIAKADVGKYRVRIKNEQHMYLWKVWESGKTEAVVKGSNYPLEYAARDVQDWLNQRT